METYVSIIVPYFNRIHYLKKLISSVRKFADMPYELIVHDDSSIDGSTPEVFDMRNDMSTLVVNTGHNLGLHASVNRLVNLSTSEYIIFLNADCVFVSSCFNEIVDILSKQYIGYLHLINQHSNDNVSQDNLKFRLASIESSSAMAFRRSVFKQVGGWNENFFSTSADVSFMMSIFRCGYFAASPYKKQYVRNLSYDIALNKDSSMGLSGYDCSYPQIFHMDEREYNRYCKEREHLCNQFAHLPEFRKFPAGETNFDYWTAYLRSLLHTKPGKTQLECIDWNTATIHGHDKFKDQILNDDALKI